MKVLVTGATGFIGRHVVKRLSQTGHELSCMVRSVNRAADLQGYGAALVPGDVTDRSSITQAVMGCDCVINLANVYSMWEPDRKTFTAVNVVGTRNLMECSLENRVSKVLHVSTAGVYGKPADCPFTEDSEVGPVRFSEYARTKYLGDLIAWELYEMEGLPLVVLYPGAVLGPGDTKPTGRYIQDLVRRRMPVTVFRNSVMTYVYVKDVAETIVRAAEKDGNVGEKYLIGKYQLSFGEFNEMVSRISGVPLPKIGLPDAAVDLAAALLTRLSDVTKRPPLWGMSVDQARMAEAGFRFDGSKVERELGITYTPISVAVEDTIRSLEDKGRST
jgi:dihydroflavonol-4-reductase